MFTSWGRNWMSQRLLGDGLLHKNDFQAAMKMRGVRTAPEGWASGPQRAHPSIHPGAGQGGMKVLPPPCLQRHPLVAPSLWPLTTIFLGHASCSQCLLLGRKVFLLERAKLTSQGTAVIERRGRELPASPGESDEGFPGRWLMTGSA